MPGLNPRRASTRKTASSRAEADTPARARTAPARPRKRTIVQRAADLLVSLDRGEFPPSVYLEGPSEPVKAALLAELRAAWLKAAPDAPPARVYRAAECGVEEILAAYHGASLFHPRELLVVLGVEDLGRSQKKIVALADGIARSSETACLFLVESAAETVRKLLAPLKEACRVLVEALPPGRSELLGWGKRRFRRAALEVDPGVLEAIADACEGDALTFFNEVDKLAAFCGAAGRVRMQDATALLRPTVGAELPEYLVAVANGDTGLAAQRLSRILAAGVGEGAALWALANLVGGALGGWARNREASDLLRRRASPRGLSRALDAVYRAEAAWKGGRADVVAVLEQATREVCAAE